MKKNVFIRHIVEFYVLCDNICIPVNLYLTRTFSPSTLVKNVTEVYLQLLLMKIVIDKISKKQSLIIFS